MADINADYGEKLVTAIESRSRQLRNNVEQGNALLYQLSKSDNIRTVSGGSSILEEIDLEENSTFQYYSGYEVLDTTPSDTLTTAKYDWKLAAVQVTASGHEIDVINTGPEQTIELLGGRMRNAERTMKNQVSVGIYSDGTGSSGKQIDGLQDLVRETPAATVAGINSSTYSNWNNQEEDYGAATSADIQGYMNTLWLECTFGNETPTMIVMGATLFSMYWESLQTNQRFMDADRAGAGFRALEYAGVPVYYENAAIDAGTGYFLNTNYLHWRPHVRRNMVPLDRRTPVNQDAVVVPIVFAGNLTCSGRRYQGVLYT